MEAAAQTNAERKLSPPGATAFLITEQRAGAPSGIFQRTEYSVSDRGGSWTGEKPSRVPVRLMHI